MKVNLRQVPSGSDPRRIHAEVNASHLKWWGENPFCAPVVVDAVIQNSNGVLRMEYDAVYTLKSGCARCLEPLEQQSTVHFDHVLVEQVEDEEQDAFILVPDLMLDLDELVLSDLSLEVEGVLLCREDCQGLCPVCGANRNTRLCGCSTTEPDHRFDALRALLAEQQAN